MHRPVIGVGACDQQIEALNWQLTHWRTQSEFLAKHHAEPGDFERWQNADDNAAGCEAGIAWWQAERARSMAAWQAKQQAAPVPRAKGAVVSSYEFSPADTFRGRD